jgi:hypothetical protein
MPADPKLACLVDRAKRLSAQLNATLQEHDAHLRQARALIGEILGVDMPIAPPARAPGRSGFHSKLN